MLECIIFWGRKFKYGGDKVGKEEGGRLQLAGISAAASWNGGALDTTHEEEIALYVVQVGSCVERVTFVRSSAEGPANGYPALPADHEAHHKGGGNVHPETLRAGAAGEALSLQQRR